MHIRLLFLILFVSVVWSLGAVNVGYCSGEYSKTGTFSVSGNTNVSGAIYLTPSLLASYDGCEITALRGALASKVNIDNLTLWVRESLDGDNLADGIVTSTTTPSLAKGWMEVALHQPIKIDATKGLYLGMTYHQKGETKAFSLVGNGFHNSFYVSIGNEKWEDRHEEGILSIEAVVAGADTPDYDLGLMEATLDYSSDGEWNIVAAKIANNGKNAVNGFTLEYAYANSPEDIVSKHFEEVINPGEKCDVICGLPKVDDVFSNPVSVRIAGVDDGDDAFDGNNSTIARIPSQKKVLVEEFTTEKCSNCPRVAQYMHEVCDEEAYRDRVIVICHHAGYFTDWLTQECDEEIAWLYGAGFAPAVMYDRTELPKGDMADTPTTKDLRDNFDRQLSLTPAVGISLTTNLNDGELLVNVTLKREGSFNFSDPRLSVYLTEDNIKPLVQSGDKDKTHIHQHVIRGYNSTWGDKIEWDGSGFNASYIFTLDDSWKVEDLKVAAFVNNCDSEDVRNNKIENAECCSVVSTPDSVAIIGSTEEVSTEYYDLSGNRVSEDAKGLLIKLTRQQDGTFRATKYFNH